MISTVGLLEQAKWMDVAIAKNRDAETVEAAKRIRRHSIKLIDDRLRRAVRKHGHRLEKISVNDYVVRDAVHSDNLITVDKEYGIRKVLWTLDDLVGVYASGDKGWMLVDGSPASQAELCLSILESE